jgi:hypothetical protein
MKYVMTWRKKRHGTTAEYEAAQRRVLELMRAWRRPERVAIREFVVRVGGTGGYAVFETDDVAVVRQATAAFSGFNFHIDPVVDVDEALAASGIVIAWRDAAVLGGRTDAQDQTAR